MNPIIALHRDQIRHANGEEQSFSGRWAELARCAGFGVRQVHLHDTDLLEQIRGCDAFMWRFGYSQRDLACARRVLAAVEFGMGMPVYPNVRTAWHFEDKIAQFYLLEGGGFPVPKTRVLWDRDAALEYCERAEYPLVIKLAWGIQSRNVKRIDDRLQAQRLVRRLFSTGAFSLYSLECRMAGAFADWIVPARLATGGLNAGDVQSGYLLAQEYLPDNDHDTRVTVIGHRAFAFRRFNRPGDFRASGSGRIDWRPECIDTRFVELAFDIASRFGLQSVAIDGLMTKGRPSIIEISYTFASWAVRDCPGHWQRLQDGALEWVSGPMRPEDAIFDSFMQAFDKTPLERQVPMEART